MAGKYGIKETKEVLDLGFFAARALQSALEDGKIDLADIGQVMLIIPKIGPAFEKINLVPKELSELDAPEQKELLDYATKQLGDLGSGKLIQVVASSLKIGLAVIELFAAIKK